MENTKLKEFERYIRGRKVAIIGIGVSNVPLIDYLYNFDAKVTIFERKKITEIDTDIINKINKYSFNMINGESALDELTGFDIIFRSPSCMPYIPQIEEEIERGAIVTSEIELVMKLAPCTIIGVTGTEGKTTTTSIINAIIKKTGRKCFLGGNIGTPLFDKIKDMNKEDIVILELSSFQLTDVDVSPQIAVVTNIYPDHLNVHRSYEEYREAKKNIFKFQNKDGITILNYDNEYTRDFAKEVNGNKIFFSSETKLNDGYIYDKTDETIKYCENGVRRHLIKKEDIKLKGVHNYENICAALGATIGIVDIFTAIEAIKEFSGVEHRLEFVRELDGVKWYNDSIGTSPASTIAGLNSFDENIILIAGGSDKGLDYTEIGKVIANKVGKLILVGPTSEKIEKATKDALNEKEMPIYHCSNMEEVVNLAKDISAPGDVVLLSPASASFDLYKNYMERGDKFKKLVNELK